MGHLTGPFGLLAQSAHHDITAVLHPQQLVLRSNQFPNGLRVLNPTQGRERKVIAADLISKSLEFERFKPRSHIPSASASNLSAKASPKSFIW
jgi:hypothetical protein